MTKDDFVGWKTSLITQAVFMAINNRIEELKEELAQQAGVASYRDGKNVGAIQALRDILDIDFEEIKNGN